MTAKNNVGILDSYASIELVRGVRVNVKVLDVKYSYGNERYLITPLCGTGEVWVDAGRCTIITASEARTRDANHCLLPERTLVSDVAEDR